MEEVAAHVEEAARELEFGGEPEEATESLHLVMSLQRLRGCFEGLSRKVVC